MIAGIDRSLPVIFLDTGKHFEETLSYRDALIADFGLSDVRVLTPDEAALERLDPDGKLHLTSTDACCEIRKVEPLARGIAPFRAWFTGRKRFQASTRAALPVFESVGSRIRINPLARWTTADQADYMRAHALRENPLVAYGYLSIGCFPCTQAGAAGRRCAQRPLGWTGQDRMRHSPVGPRPLIDRRIALGISVLHDRTDRRSPPSGYGRLQGFREDEWSHAESADALAGNGRFILPLQAFLDLDPEMRKSAKERLGVLLQPGDPLEKIAGLLDELSPGGAGLSRPSATAAPFPKPNCCAAAISSKAPCAPPARC